LPNSLAEQCYLTFFAINAGRAAPRLFRFRENAIPETNTTGQAPSTTNQLNRVIREFSNALNAGTSFEL
jgi:hypothetical protein